ncbi:MAG: SAM-dependent chlorinase/fluorinase [Chloroflexota bacterium]|nr:SAM-dependent chlorinase/fluorinase [Chloroflexota bacterium]
MGKIPLVTLITDFGTADSYVGSMKGVILNIAPNAQLVDITHHIAPQNVRQAAYALYTAYPFFPPHAVHLAVVDPGVGSARRPIALSTPEGAFVGPDNGIFSYVMAAKKQFFEKTQNPALNVSRKVRGVVGVLGANENEPVEAVVELTDPRYRLPQVSHTFHGRDIFAPAAAHLATGVPITDLGPLVRDLVTFPPPRLEIAAETITGEVLHADHFGNIVTSIGRLAWGGGELSLEPAFQEARGRKQEAGGGGRTRFEAGDATIVVGGRKIIGVRRTYAEVEPGETLALVGSEGYLEIAVREGSAARRLELRPGDTVMVRI